MAPGLVEALELTPAQVLIVLASREPAGATPPSAAAPVQRVGNPSDFLALVGGGPGVEVIHE